MNPDVDLWRAVLDRAIRDAHGAFKPHDPNDEKSKTLDKQEAIILRRVSKMRDADYAESYIPLQRIINPEHSLDVREARWFFMSDGEWWQSLKDICESVDVCPYRMRNKMKLLISDIKRREAKFTNVFRGTA